MEVVSIHIKMREVKTDLKQAAQGPQKGELIWDRRFVYLKPGCGHRAINTSITSSLALCYTKKFPLPISPSSLLTAEGVKPLLSPFL